VHHLILNESSGKHIERYCWRLPLVRLTLTTNPGPEVFERKHQHGWDAFQFEELILDNVRFYTVDEFDRLMVGIAKIKRVDFPRLKLIEVKMGPSVTVGPDYGHEFRLASAHCFSIGVCLFVQESS
jgi:hypothetical protein